MSPLSSMMILSSTKVFCGPVFEPSVPLFIESGIALVRSSGEGGGDENSTESINVLSGIGSPKDEKCCEANALISTLKLCAWSSGVRENALKETNVKEDILFRFVPNT